LNFKYFYVEPKTDDAALSDVEKEEQKKTAWELLENPENWHDEWDWKTRNFMPILVKIELSLLEKDGNETSFSTVVFINRDPSTVSAALQAAQAAEREAAGESAETDGEGDNRGPRNPAKDMEIEGIDRPRIDKPILEKRDVKPE
jgi:hypothetical protein